MAFPANISIPNGWVVSYSDGTLNCWDHNDLQLKTILSYNFKSFPTSDERYKNQNWFEHGVACIAGQYDDYIVWRKEKEMNKEASFFIVWCPQNASSPTYRHYSREDAEREAKRLADINQGKEFFVCQAECKYQTQSVTKTKFEMSYPPCDDKPCDDDIPF